MQAMMCTALGVCSVHSMHVVSFLKRLNFGLKRWVVDEYKHLHWFYDKKKCEKHKKGSENGISHLFIRIECHFKQPTAPFNFNSVMMFCLLEIVSWNYVKNSIILCVLRAHWFVCTQKCWKRSHRGHIQIVLTFTDFDWIDCDFFRKYKFSIFWPSIQYLRACHGLLDFRSNPITIVLRLERKRIAIYSIIERKEFRKPNCSKDERYSLSRLLQMLPQIVREPNHHVEGRNAPVPKMRQNETAI